MNPEEGLKEEIEKQDKELKEQYDKQNDPGPQPDPLDTRNLKFNLVDQIDNEQPEPDLDRYRMTPDRLAAATLYEIGQAMAVNKATANAKWAGKFGIIAYPFINFLSGAQSNYTAQQIRTVEELGWFDRNWGEILSSGLVDVIPGLDVLHKTKRGAKLAAQLSKSPARRITAGGIEAGTRTALQHQGEVALNEQRFLTNEELATSFGVGSVFGGGIVGSVEGVQGLTKGVSELRKRYGRKVSDPVIKLSPEEVYPNYDPNTGQYAFLSENLTKQIDGPIVRYRDKNYSVEPDTDPSDIHEIQKTLNKFQKQEDTLDLNIKKEEDVLEAFRLGNIPKEQWPQEFIKKQQKLKRRKAGFIRPSEIIAIAEKHNISINKVAGYLTREEQRWLAAEKVIRDFNIETNNDIFQTASIKLRELENAGLLNTGTWQKWVEIQNKASSLSGKKRYQIYSIGHQEALHKIFQKGLSGGDRSSNWDFEPLVNYYEADDNFIKVIRGNKSRGAESDLPEYTLRKLRGTKPDLEEDFLEYALPEFFTPDPDVVPVRWRGIAVKQYLKMMEEIKEAIEKRTSAQDLIYSKRKLYTDASNAVTIALTDFYKSLEKAGRLTKNPVVTKKMLLELDENLNPILQRIETLEDQGPEFLENWK